MAYVKRYKYTIINDNDLKKELLDLLKAKGVKSVKARQLVYYPVPMSLIRWAKYLEPNECEIYLEPYEEPNEEEVEENQEDFGF